MKVHFFPDMYTQMTQYDLEKIAFASLIWIATSVLI